MGRYVSQYGTYDRDHAPTRPWRRTAAGNPQPCSPKRAWALELALGRHLAGKAGCSACRLFHRRIDGLIRRRIALEVVPEATVPRWVSRPVNLGRARSTGLELEAKGRADQWLPGFFAARSPLGLRASLSVYRSRVDRRCSPPTCA
jgi:outer membrane receptor for ferrienterochelin and colicins